jgi:hypothetical protein
VSESTPAPAPRSAQPAETPATPKKRRKRLRKRVRLGKALRMAGLDEHVVAKNYVNVVEKLAKKTAEENDIQKLLVDVLKECSRVLDQPDAQNQPADGPAPVQLIHNLARPDREKTPNENVAAPAGREPTPPRTAAAT